MLPPVCGSTAMGAAIAPGGISFALGAAHLASLSRTTCAASVEGAGAGASEYAVRARSKAVTARKVLGLGISAPVCEWGRLSAGQTSHLARGAECPRRGGGLETACYQTRTRS